VQAVAARKVIEALCETTFGVKLRNGYLMTSFISGKMRKLLHPHPDR